VCGIAGLVRTNGIVVSSEQTKTMCSAMSHRGPDNEGIWLDATGRCCLGHRRLSILDLSHAADQPMLSQTGRFAITFNGEIYNYKELRSRLEKEGIRFRGTSDTEVLIEWLASRGLDGVRNLEGMFAFGLWDSREAALYLVRDPLGIKPCYYVHHSGRMLAFASEVKSLLAGGVVEREVDFGGLVSYLSYGSVQGPQTMCKGVEELPPAHIMKLDSTTDRRAVARYWEPKYPGQERATQRYVAEEFAERLDAAVASHLVSDVPIGAFLSGGVDSSAVVAAMVHRGASTIRTLCVALPSGSVHTDAYYGRLVAAHLGTIHDEVSVSETELNRLALSSLAAMDQPTIDGINTYVVSHAAHLAGLKVAVSGLGGDELFGGYPGFAKLPRYSGMLRRLGRRGRMAAGQFVGACQRVSGHNRLVHRLGAFLRASGGVAGLYPEYYRNFSAAEVAWLLNEADVGDLPDAIPSVWNALVASCQGLDDLDAVSWLELNLHMGNTMLRDTDTMSMASSLEVRVPLLHWPFVEYAQVLGRAVREHHRNKEVLVATMKGRVPEGLFERRKMGFWMPMDRLILNDLRPAVEERVACADEMLFGGRATILWKEYVAGPEKVGWKRVWTLIALAEWAVNTGVGFLSVRSNAGRDA
jgi:asparagine synthase (glutamine-hydrolysing)